LIKIIEIIFLSVLGGIVYRYGGSANGQRWVREAGQGLCFILAILVLGLVSWAWQPILGVILGFGICWAESTYFKAKGTDAKWLSWALVGLVFGLILLPYCILTNSHWIGFCIRVPVCVVITVLWQEVLSDKIAKLFGMGKEVTDEFGRGFINIIARPLLLL